MKVFEMRIADRSVPGGWRVDYFRVAGAFQAFVVAKVMGHNLKSIRVVPDDTLAEIDPSMIDEVDPHWLMVLSPLHRRPIITIAAGFALGQAAIVLAGIVLGAVFTGS